MIHILSIIHRTITTVLHSMPSTCVACGTTIPCLIVPDPIEQYYREAKRQRRYEWIENNIVKRVDSVKNEYTENLR